jgi:SagB-type dehydrogenase family enzyme
MSDVDKVLAYHERTKHHPRRFARSLGYMDWATQPDPFRTYAGAPQVELSRPPPTREPLFDALAEPARLPAAPPGAEAVAQLLFDSLALSAHKAAGGARWSLRCNPSSGNLHPTEAYLLAPALEGLGEEAALYHYAPRRHRLERRRVLTRCRWGLPPDTLLLGLTSIHWREAWKYGERAFRYCQHDVGHALAAVAYAVAALGWQARLLEGIDDANLALLLGVDGQRGEEAEHPDCLLALSPAGREVDWRPAPDLLAGLRRAPLLGEPNRLSPEHHPWPVISEVAAASRREGPADAGWCVSNGSNGVTIDPQRAAVAARQLFRTRRSAVTMDGRSRLTLQAFVRMLRRLLPGAGPPLDAMGWRPAVHLLLFVHRVDGLAPGLYLLVRDAGQQRDLRAAINARYAWEGPVEELPLFRLADGDWRAVARDLSCQQAIASDGAFTAAMLAELEPRLRRHGAWAYRRLFWEAGALGQVLYLEAEAAGLRGCGIGCFFDDLVHELLGLEDRRYQALYHFTVGGAVDDPRLQTLPAYE